VNIRAWQATVIVVLLGLLAAGTAACGGGAGAASPSATTPLSPGGLIVASQDPPMAIALPAGWTKETPKAGEVIRASRQDSEVVAEVIAGTTDRATALAPLFGADFAKDPKVRTFEQQLPMGTPLRAGTSTMVAYAYTVGDHVVRLTFRLTVITGSSTDWDAIAVGFNPAGTTFP
jgi:hypothetical protein